jgi:hypothetical protein
VICNFESRAVPPVPPVPPNKRSNVCFAPCCLPVGATKTERINSDLGMFCMFGLELEKRPLFALAS